MNFDRIPNELKTFDNWVLWRFEDRQAEKPTKVPYSAKDGRAASVKNRDSWSSFLNCISVFNSGNYDGIGFVLSDEDPFTFIDLDDCKGDEKALDRQIEIYNKFQSYAERSPSGKGLHIIVKGSVPAGRKRSFVEVYSNYRFMTMTGDVYRDLPICDCNDAVNALFEQMGSSGEDKAKFYLGIGEEIYTDDQVYNFACSAANGEKFYNLFVGNWQQYYNSQSEADFALINIIAFYSKNRIQVKRIFEYSQLAKRDKAKREDYMKWMLNRCFDNLLPPIDIEGLRNRLNEAIDKKIAGEKERFELSKQRTVAERNDAISTPEIVNQGLYSMPPGLLGEVAKFIFEQSARPVPEIALAGAIGLLSGIVGRAYNVSSTGLNQYIMLLAATGTGKESIRKGIDKLMSHVVRSVPAANEFIGPAAIASEQAIIKYMAKGSTSLVSILGEIGILLQQMASTNAPEHKLGLRRFLLDVYNKSGEGDILRPSIYSDSQKNTDIVKAPAFSLVGESTQEKFYEGLHEGLISEGLLPRFTIIEYNGKRPALNEGHFLVKPSFELVDKLANLCAHSLALNSNNKVINVQTNDEATDRFKTFDKYCDRKINSCDREVRKHLWNRAHLKALKLSAVVAVGCNPFDPVINAAVADWAINIIVADVENMLKRFDSGEIGADNDEMRQIAKLCEAVKHYATVQFSEVKSYIGEGFIQLHRDAVVPYSFIHKRLCQLSIFRKDRIGSSNAVKRAIKTMVDRDDLKEIPKHEMQQKYQTSALGYMIANPGAFDL